jgi:seryl-tRNA synthetase
MRPFNISVLVALVLAFNLSAAQVSAQEQTPSQKSEMKSMGKMSSMDEMMKDCKEHHQSAMKSIDQMTKMMDGAKQSNDPAKMRAALDQGQKQLGEMKEHMTMCGNMMSMMEKMPGMGGMMKGQKK